MQNPLDRFLTENGLTNAQFAETVGTHHTAISRIRAGTRRPGAGLAARIELATKGAVPASALSCMETGSAA